MWEKKRVTSSSAGTEKSTISLQQTKISPGKQTQTMQKHTEASPSISFSWIKKWICTHAFDLHIRIGKKKCKISSRGRTKASSWPAGSIFQIRSVSGDLSVSLPFQVSISLCLNRLSLTVLALPVYLSR